MGIWSHSFLSLSWTCIHGCEMGFCSDARPRIQNKKGTHNLSRDLPKCVKRYVDEKVRGCCGILTRWNGCVGETKRCRFLLLCPLFFNEKNGIKAFRFLAQSLIRHPNGCNSSMWHKLSHYVNFEMAKLTTLHNLWSVFNGLPTQIFCSLLQACVCLEDFFFSSKNVGSLLVKF